MAVKSIAMVLMLGMARNAIAPDANFYPKMAPLAIRHRDRLPVDALSWHTLL